MCYIALHPLHVTPLAGDLDDKPLLTKSTLV
jgi:hypothetical protein